MMVKLPSFEWPVMQYYPMEQYPFDPGPVAYHWWVIALMGITLVLLTWAIYSLGRGMYRSLSGWRNRNRPTSGEKERRCT